MNPSHDGARQRSFKGGSTRRLIEENDEDLGQWGSKVTTSHRRGTGSPPPIPAPSAPPAVNNSMGSRGGLEIDVGLVDSEEEDDSGQRTYVGYAGGGRRRTQPKALHVPSEYATIGQALSDSISGDVVHICTPSFPPPI